MVLTKHDLDSGLDRLKTDFKEMLDASIQSVKNEIMKRLVEENKRLNAEITSLKGKVVELEKSHQENLQYQRNTNCIIKGIQKEVAHEELEGVVLNLFNKVCGYSISTRDIVASHRLSTKTNNVIVKFVNKKDAVSLKDAYKEINKLKYEEAGLERCKDLKVEDHLTYNMANLAYRCRQLVRDGTFLKSKCQNGKLKVLSQDNNWYSIGHLDDIKKLVDEYE